ncbi:MAG TPA: YIP1 family protein [Gemmatimonadales bacterium]|nr:YIP1 family protein [Gemmatimonadales bacterium]
MQPPAVSQTQGEGSSFADVFKVLYEPTAVFERVRNGPNFIAPFITIIVAQCVLFFVNLPFMKVAMQAQFAARGASGGPTPSTGMIAGFGLVGLVIVLGVVLVLSAFILWALVSVFGGDAKFSRLLSVTTFSAIPAAILLAAVGTLVLHLQGTSGLTSPQDMQPALGLDLLAPGMKGFLAGVLKGINPFSIWGFVLTAIGVSTTHRLSKSTGYTVAAIQFAIGLLITGAFATLGGR